jgi:nucleoside-diphosphate kinase
VTDPAQAAPGTIRGDYAISIARNVIHASEDATFAQEEIARFFTAQELYTYTRCDEAMLYETDR